MKIKISPSLPMFLILFCITKSTHRLLIPLLVAFVHECGHLLAARIMGIKIKSMTLGLLGANIVADIAGCSYAKEIILCAAGPFFNIISCLPFFVMGCTDNTHILYFIIVSLFLAFLNLLPAKGFDGGRIVTGILNCIFSPITAYKVIEVTSFMCFFLLWSLSVYIIFRTGAYLSLLFFSMCLFARFFLVILSKK